MRECGEDDSAYFQRCKYVFSITPVARLQVFLGHLTHQSSLHTTPCLPGLLVPSRTPWAGSCNSKLDFIYFFFSSSHKQLHLHATVRDSSQRVQIQERKGKKKKVCILAFFVKNFVFNICYKMCACRCTVSEE